MVSEVEVDRKYQVEKDMASKFKAPDELDLSSSNKKQAWTEFR